MGLDILLIRIVKEPVDENCWLSAEDSPELLSKYGKLLNKRTYDDATEDQGYWYQELS